MLTRDTTYLDAPEGEPDYCEVCDKQHQVVLDEDGEVQKPERCSCRCHWDAEDYRIEALNLAGEDV